MNSPHVRIAKPVLAVVLAASAFFFSSLSGCMGGTSTEAGNPGLTLEFREDGRNVEVSGAMQFYVANSNPEFYNPEPDDGDGTRPRVEIENRPRWDAIGFAATHTYSLSRSDIAGALFERPQLVLQKRAAAQDQAVLPDFNIVVIGNGGRMSLLAGIHMDPETGEFSVTGGGKPGDNLIVDISQERDYSGTVDTSTAAGRPIALFVPGTNFYAPVRKNAFTFFGLPAGRMPLRWVSANGVIRDMPDSLGAAWTKPLQPGERVDSIALPEPMVAVQLPSATPPGQFAFTDSVSVTLNSEAGAAIYYSLDGSTPDNNSKPYTVPIIIRSSATLKAVAYIKGRNHSAVSVNNYTLVPAQPTALPASRTFRDTLRITLTSKSEDAIIYYTLDGSEPGAGSRTYTQPFLIDSTAILKAVTDVSGLGRSRVTEEKYIRLDDSLPEAPADSLPLSAKPVAAPAAGTYTDTVHVVLATPAEGASIYYTLDGSEPGITSTLFSGVPLVLAANTVVKAVAVSEKGKSPVMTGSYLVTVPNP
jgi:hypothetical protein